MTLLEAGSFVFFVQGSEQSVVQLAVQLAVARAALLVALSEVRSKFSLWIQKCSANG